jgi:YD repeat
MQVYYVHLDHLNTPRRVTDEHNTVLWKNPPLSEPFGLMPPEEDPDGDGRRFILNLRFPGQYFDTESFTHYNFFRDYDPLFGRYLQSDPIGLDGEINTYSYVENRPTMMIDPEGLNPDALPLLTIPAIPSAASICLSNPLACAVGTAGVSGYVAGSLIYPYIEPSISKIVDWCISSTSKQECYDKCYLAYLTQVSICKMSPTPKVRAQCYARAGDLHGQCRAGC